MTHWKRSVNDWLTRLTGYEVVRARRSGRSHSGSEHFPADYDESYREIIAWLDGKDPTTRTMLEGILATEEEHAEDMSSLLAGLKG